MDDQVWRGLIDRRLVPKDAEPCEELEMACDIARIDLIDSVDAAIQELCVVFFDVFGVSVLEWYRDLE